MTRPHTPAPAGEGAPSDIDNALPCNGPDDTPYSEAFIDRSWAEIEQRAASNGDEGAAHMGDPCIKCGTPHDSVPVGPCRGVAAAVEDVSRQMKWEREGHASIRISSLRTLLSALSAHQEREARAREAILEAIRDNTPAKHEGTLAAHVTGKNIEAAVLEALQSLKETK